MFEYLQHRGGDSREFAVGVAEDELGLVERAWHEGLIEVIEFLNERSISLSGLDTTLRIFGCQ